MLGQTPSDEEVKEIIRDFAEGETKIYCFKASLLSSFVPQGRDYRMPTVSRSSNTRSGLGSNPFRVYYLLPFCKLINRF